MPPKAKITKKMITEAGLNIVREEGEDALSVRRVAAQLNCSTQPVMYHYKTVEELKADVYAAADDLHTGFIMMPDENTPHPMLSIGLRYILFAHEEKHLFRFLFQSSRFNSRSFRQIVGSDETGVMIKPLCESTGLNEEQAKEAFETLFICVHGAASMIANNDIDYDESYFIRLLTTTFMGIIGFMKGEGTK